MQVLDRVTGKAIESQIEEFARVYGEVLLGLHRDSQAQLAILDETRATYGAQIDELRSQIQNHEALLARPAVLPSSDAPSMVRAPHSSQSVNGSRALSWLAMCLAILALLLAALK